MQIWVYRPCSADRLPKAALPGTDLFSGLLQTATFIRIRFSEGSGHMNSWVYLLNMKTITEAGTLHCKSLFSIFHILNASHPNHLKYKSMSRLSSVLYLSLLNIDRFAEHSHLKSDSSYCSMLLITSDVCLWLTCDAWCSTSYMCIIYLFINKKEFKVKIL